TGPLPGLPATFCFRDFRHLAAGAESLLGEEGREPEAIAAVMLGIALLDGARASGLDVSREERELEALLRRLEERGTRIECIGCNVQNCTPTSGASVRLDNRFAFANCT